MRRRISASISEKVTKPVYEIPGDKKKVVDELTKLAKSKTVWLASDEDREGEAIAWHLTEVLGLPVDQTKRIVFHEITKRAILEAIEKPRTVNMDLVNAQQARRILDRLVGFELSPVLWKKVRPALSAGRVQSVAVRLIVEREREIIAFRSAAYFRVVAQFYAAGDPEKTLFKAELSSRFETEAQAETFLQSCIGATFTVAKAEEKPAQRYPAPPFTTSTLQQEAGRKLGMSVSQTMSVAQHLYEQGLITYMRTDSVNLSQQALAQCKEEITKLYGEKYSRWYNYKTKTKGAQEAHEAIRPSYIERQEIEGTPAEKKLYDLIWKRTVASQMVCAELDRTTITIDMSGSSNQFVAQGEVVRFDGFLRLYSESTDDDQAAESGEGLLPKLTAGDRVLPSQITATERFTSASGPLQRGLAGQTPRRTGHRPSFDLRTDDHHDHQPRLRRQTEQGRAEAQLRTADAHGRKRSPRRPSRRTTARRRTAFRRPTSAWWSTITWRSSSARSSTTTSRPASRRSSTVSPRATSPGTR